jgi:hypothetical protein
VTLGILLPTRGRPDNLDRFITATVLTAVDWHLYLRLDYDDPEWPGYEKVLAEWPHYQNQITVVQGERIGFGASLNELAARAERDGVSHVGMFGDDVVPETEHWDTRLVEALGEDLGVAYGDDGLRDKHQPDLPTHYITQTEVYRRLGYLSPPTIRHLFLDNVARDVGRYLGNFVFVPVTIKHLHPWAEGEHIDDATYKEGGRNPNIRKADRMAYIRWTQDREWKRRLR